MIKQQLFVFGFFFLAHTSYANSNYWKCSADDRTNRVWAYTHKYQKAAINLAYAECRKQSSYPGSCEANTDSCHYYALSKSRRSIWQCTALDKLGKSFAFTSYATTDDAAIGALNYCKRESKLPKTCYINTVSCENLRTGYHL